MSIKVIGVGGAGCNSVSYLVREDITNIEVALCNTDKRQLDILPKAQKILLGKEVSKGLGAGNDPEKGREAAEESEEQIRKFLQGTRLLFLAAGMGKGTGTGATPVIAEIARKMGITTVAVITMPFREEGEPKVMSAYRGLKNIRKYVDSLIIISNQKLVEQYGHIKTENAYKKTDLILYAAIKGVVDVIYQKGHQNIDLNDVLKVLKNSGTAFIGSGRADGENRATKMIENALKSPLLYRIEPKGAKQVLLCMTANKESLKMNEIGEAKKHLLEVTGKRPQNIMFGSSYNQNIPIEELQTIIIFANFQKLTQIEKTLTNQLQPTIEEIKRLFYESGESPIVDISDIENMDVRVVGEDVIHKINTTPAYIRNSHTRRA